MQKKEINMIFSMTDFEMQLVLASLRKTLKDKVMENNRYNSNLKKLEIKINRMIERQKPYA
jgi:hypothetical protein